MGHKKVICDYCGAVFAISQIITVDVDESHERLYFKCPSCRGEYEICVRDKSKQLPLVSRSR